MDTFKRPYEISLWEDELVWHRRKLSKVQINKDSYEKGKYYSVNPNIKGTPQYQLDTRDFDSSVTYYSLAPISEDNNLEGTEADIEVPAKSNYWRDANGNLVPQIILQYYKETKLCVIGSDTMDSPARCVNPKLVQKVNGENTLTFTMYYRYWDDDVQAVIDNPFNYFMVNERKIKLRLGPEAETEDDTRCKWFDFIIKNVQENSETKAFTYTCKDQFVNELSKSGFELVLDNELENNMGTIDVLAKRILEGSDWQVDGANTENLKQYKEEPLYKIKVAGALSATSLEKIGEGKDAAYQIIEDLNGKYIYVFYSIINNKNKKIQFLYLPDDETVFITDDNLLIDKNKYLNYELDGEFEYTIGENKEWPSFTGKTGDILDANISTEYRGARLVKQVQTKYDSTIDKYVGVYKKDGKQYYGYTEDEYISSGAILNYAANPSSFTSTTGWETDANHLDYKLVSEKEKDSDLYKSYLEVDFNEKQGALIKNAGIGGNRSSIGSFKKGDKYVLRMKYKNTNNAPTAKICEYQMLDGYYDISSKDEYKIFEFAMPQETDKFPIYTNEIRVKSDDETQYEYVDNMSSDGYVYMLATCLRSISEKQLSNWDFKFGLFFDFKTSGTIRIEDVQVFPYQTYIEDEKERLCVPNGKIYSEVRTKYVYYEPNKEWQSIKDLITTYSGYTNDTSFVQQYNIESDIPGADGFTKVRSISAKESNRFNLIQTLCETFECWPKFKIERNQKTGQILYDENYRQKKSVSFHEYAGEDNFVGFRYGINSKSIQRTIDSAAIVSKMIVKDNVNEFAPNGSCSIARASENPTGENFLLNFDHYVRQNLLDFDIVTNDLYLDVNGYLGYYKKLKRLNAERNTKIDIQSGLLTDIRNYESAYTAYKSSYDGAVEDQLVQERNFNKLAGTNYEHGDFAKKVEDMGKLSDDLNKYWVKWTQCQNVIIQHKPLYLKAELNLVDAKIKYQEIQAWLDDLTAQKRALNLQFYKKYSRFIQEGSWIKEDYTDPNLYYLDSESTLHTSAQPKVTYDIKVIDVAPLALQEGYKDFAYYDFKIGDKTYIEDVEFFGWSLQNRTQPYREEIVVSEITTELDAPEKNQIKVKNYKTQFEDLFQRITAQTQQAEYHTGEYQRAAAIVEPNGTIAQSTLENSFANNSFKLSNARDQSVVWDESGITTTSLSNPSEMVRIISGGIFLSTDGGASWKTGITGSGINTSYLTTGQINTNEIIIRSGVFSSFRWDSTGLNAYEFKIDDKGNPHSFNTSKFVRFDQYGIYGIDGNSNFIPSSDDDIWQNENTKYALTWKGFLLKNDNGSVEISSKDDIQVKDGQKERIKIGRISEIGAGENKIYTYGIRISDNDGVVMETGDDGRLWLKSALIVGNGTASTVKIGYLSEYNENNARAVISAGSDNKRFVVYEDGQISVTGADVSGKIEATEGYIGGLRLSEGILQSTNEEGENTNLTINTKTGEIFASNIIVTGESSIGGLFLNEGVLQTATTDEEPEPALTINTNSGEIYAKNITLGEGATINSYLNLGQKAQLRSPTDGNNAIFQITEQIDSENSKKYLTITDTGVLTLGDIVLDGQKSEIYSKGNFSITPQVATFNNINCSGAIETVIFRKNSVQSAGGAMIFSPSYKIKYAQLNNDNIKVTVFLEDAPEFEEVTEQSSRIVWLSTLGKNLKGKIKNFNKQNSQNEDGTYTVDVVLESKQDKTFALNNGSLIDLGQENEQIIMGINSGNSEVYNILKPKGFTIYGPENEESDLRVFMGDLTSVNKTGYGLYADNVYLNGSLTTKSSTGKIAGVNTVSQVKGKKEKIGSEKPIIFWAGSNSENAKDIQDAPFQVTEDGYVYANQVTLTGRIEAADIYDASKGISFKRRVEGGKEDITVFAIRSDGFYNANNNCFLKPNTTGKVEFIGDFVNGNARITNEEGALLVKIEDITTASFIKSETRLLETVKYISDKVTMEYRSNSNGYDLYITA